MVLMMWTQMDEYYREEKSSPARFRESLLGGQASAVRFLLERAARRGEVESRQLTDMVIAIPGAFLAYVTATQARSEERRVGKESDSTCRSRWSRYPYTKNKTPIPHTKTT